MPRYWTLKPRSAIQIGSIVVANCSDYKVRLAVFAPDDTRIRSAKPIDKTPPDGIESSETTQ